MKPIYLLSIAVALLAVAFMQHLYDHRQAARGGSASVGGCGVAIGGASGDGTPGQVVIRKCNP